MSNEPEEFAAMMQEKFMSGETHPATADLAARLAKAERALEEAERVIKPFAFEADQWHEYAEIEALVVDAWATSLNVGHLRAARKWMESRHDA